jgi:Flp pilus assembly protein TadD
MKAVSLLLLLALAGCAGKPAQAANDRGKACLAAKNFECARLAFEEAIAAEPTDAAFHYNLGLALGHLGRHADAERALQEALRLRPTFGAATEALQVVREQKAKAGK